VWLKTSLEAWQNVVTKANVAFPVCHCFLLPSLPFTLVQFFIRFFSFLIILAACGFYSLLCLYLPILHQPSLPFSLLTVQPDSLLIYHDFIWLLNFL